MLQEGGFARQIFHREHQDEGEQIGLAGAWHTPGKEFAHGQRSGEPYRRVQQHTLLIERQGGNAPSFHYSGNGQRILGGSSQGLRVHPPYLYLGFQ